MDSCMLFHASPIHFFSLFFSHWRFPSLSEIILLFSSLVALSTNGPFFSKSPFEGEKKKLLNSLENRILLEQYWCWWMLIITFDSIAMPYGWNQCVCALFCCALFMNVYDMFWWWKSSIHPPKSNHPTTNLCAVKYIGRAVAFFIANILTTIIFHLVNAYLGFSWNTLNTLALALSANRFFLFFAVNIRTMNN